MGQLTIHYSQELETELLMVVRILGAVDIKIRPIDDLGFYNSFVMIVSGPSVPNRKEPTSVVKYHEEDKRYGTTVSKTVSYNWLDGV